MMVECEMCGNEFDEWHFTNGTPACDYCYAMLGLGYIRQPLTAYFEKSKRNGLFD
jgi:NAD-dependent SIR2 family protein deacetylase